MYYFQYYNWYEKVEYRQNDNTIALYRAYSWLLTIYTSSRSERSCPRASSKDASIDTRELWDVAYHYFLSLPTGFKSQL